MAITSTSAGPETPETLTTSGVKLAFIAKGLCQPEITVRYRMVEDAVDCAQDDYSAIYRALRDWAHANGIRLVTDGADTEAQR